MRTRIEVERAWGVPLQLRLGLHTGSVIVGRIGDDLHMDYTVQGDTTSLATQLQQMAPPGSIWVSEKTYRVARDAFVWQAVGLMGVPGKPAPVPVYALLGPRETQSRFEVRARQELTRFVGRYPELQCLLALWERAEQGEGQVVSVVGEAGIGKSRLVYEFKQWLRQQGGWYVEGSCFTYGEAILYLPFLAIVRGLCGLDGNEPEDAARARIQQCLRTLSLDPRDIAPYLHHLLVLPVEDDVVSALRPDLVRQRTVEALKMLLLAAVHHRPAIIILEDVHCD